MAENNRKLDAVILVMGGAIVGAGLTLLFAPDSGRKTRKNLQRMGKRALNRADEFQSQLREQVDELVEDLVETGSQGLEKGRSLAGKIRGEVVDALEGGRKVLENEKQRVQQLFH
ncbi:MAG: YtxH domain-containing protein [Acidobacteria bacterium]|nr:YtxH domain-containing protein [Acidobacteriota bacterium]